MKKTALFGGSFNPAHEGHFEMAKYIHQTLGVDEVPFLFSVNWQKDSAKYAALEHRMEMGRIMAQHYPDMPFVMSDMQEQLGTHLTCEVLTGIQKHFPDDRFIWVMGADSLASFHSWKNFEYIIENFPLAVVRRPGFNDQALQSYTALTYPHLKRKPEDLAAERNGWCMLDNPEIDMSSSNFLDQLRSGQRKFDGPLQDIADYILRHELYGVNSKPHDLNPQEEKPEIS